MGYRLTPTTMASAILLPPPYTGSYIIGELEDVPAAPGPSPFLRGETSARSSGTAVVTLTLPATTQVGDTVVLIQKNDWFTLASMPAPTGTAVTTWAEKTDARYDGGTNANHTKVWVGTVTTGGAATVISGWVSPSDGGEERYAQALVFIGSAPYDVGSTVAAAASTSWTAPSVNASTDGSYLVVSAGTDGTLGETNFSFPGSMTALTEADAVSASYRSAYELLSSAGATGTRTVTSSNSRAGDITSIVVAPAATTTTYQGAVSLSVGSTLTANGTLEAAGTVSLAATTTLSAGALSGLYVDDFGSYPLTSWAEGSTHGYWNAEFLGGGSAIPVDVSGNRVIQFESAVPTGSQTFAALLRSTVSTSGDLTFEARARTVQQLRAVSPNGWESVWLGWNYTNPSSGLRRFYYIALKPNGFELGKVDQSIALPGGQRFLWTDSTPFSIGTWYQVKIQQTGARIQVWVDGTSRADFTDGVGSGGTPVWGTTGETVMTSGVAVLYEEDARVQVDDVQVRGTLAAISGAVTLSASSTLSAAGFLTENAAVNLSAGATLSVAPGPIAASASLTATSALTTNGVRVVAGAVTLSQTPTLTVSGAVSQPVAAVLAAAASLTAVGVLGAAGAVSLVITNTLSAGAQLTTGGAVALTTSQSLLLTPLLGGFGVASLSALPSLTVSSIRITSASVTLSSSPALLVSASQVMVASVGMVATGVLSVTAGSVIGNVSLVVGKTLSVAGTLQAFGAVSLTSTTSLSVAGIRTAFGSVTLSAVPVLTAGVSVGITNGSASLAALGSLSVNGIRVLNVGVGGVPLVAVGLLNVNGSTGSGGGTNLNATSTLLVSGVRVLFGAAQLNALPVISLGGIAVGFGTLALTVGSSLAVASVVSRIGAVTLVISSTITTQLFGVVVGAVALSIESSLLFIDLFPEIDFGVIGGWSTGPDIHVDSRPYPRTKLSPSWTTAGTHVGSAR